MAENPEERIYRDNNVCWKLHRHYIRPFITLSILLVVFLYFASPSVDNTFPYVASRVNFRRNRAVLECISIKLVFVSPTPLSSLTYTVWFMVFYGHISYVLQFK